MEDGIGFRKKQRPAGSSAIIQVVESRSGGGGRPGGKAGGAKSAVKARSVGAAPLQSNSRGKKPIADVADHISRQLKAVYDDMLNKPVPDRFLDLLSQLDPNSDKQ